MHNSFKFKMHEFFFKIQFLLLVKCIIFSFDLLTFATLGVTSSSNFVSPLNLFFILSFILHGLSKLILSLMKEIQKIFFTTKWKIWNNKNLNDRLSALEFKRVRVRGYANFVS